MVRRRKSERYPHGRKPAALGDHAAKAPDAAFMTGQVAIDAGRSGLTGSVRKAARRPKHRAR